jgi:hypothetical protein
MKKLLALVLVLAVVSLANAAMVLDLSVGADNAADVLLAPGSFVLSVTNSGNFVQPADFAGFGLVVISGSGTISGGVVTALAPSASGFDTDPANQADLAALFGGAGVYGTIASWTAGTFAGGKYLDGITFDYAGGDVLIQLITTADFETFTVADSVLVKQIPEPATMALLALGGLLFRRK